MKRMFEYILNINILILFSINIIEYINKVPLGDSSNKMLYMVYIYLLSLVALNYKLMYRYIILLILLVIFMLNIY